MIILQVNEYLIWGSSIPDWLQAIGAIVAIGGVIWGFFKFLKDSKEKQIQIDSLTILVRETKKQTNHISAQVDQMIEGNRLQTEYISLFQKYVSFSEQSVTFQEEEKALKEKRKKLETRPNFIIGGIIKDEVLFHFPLENIGEKAKHINCIGFDDNSMKFDITQFMNRDILKDNGFWLFLRPISQDLQISECLIHLKITFEDILENKYFQILEGKYSGPINISKPVEIIEATEN